MKLAGCAGARFLAGMDVASAPPTRLRLTSIDLLRGLVMVVMVLDHTRDFVHREGMTADPMDPATTTPALYFTRWITHFCAPVFVLLAGLAVRLQAASRNNAEVAARLWRRGLSLVALELLVLRPLIWFQLDPALLAFLQVIWAIGWSMCGLALLLRWRVPVGVIGSLGLLVVAAHNLLSSSSFQFLVLGDIGDVGRACWLILMRQGVLQLGQDGPVVIAKYALLPWFGVLLLGHWLGGVFALAPESRRARLLGLGLATTAAFVLLRALCDYGDPRAFTATNDTTTTIYAFLRVEKYPPSLHYLLMTLGPAMLLLWGLERWCRDGQRSWLATIGRAPLFFYVLQWPVVHLVSRGLQWCDGQPLGWDARELRQLEDPLPPGCGFTLPVVYLAWAIGMLVLIPLTLAFANWKARHPERRWLRFF